MDLQYDTLADIFNESVKQYPNNVAITYIHEDEKKELTYKELDNTATKLCSSIQQFYPVTNTIIAVFSRQNPNLIALLLGIIKGKAAFAPIGLEWPPLMVKVFLKSIISDLKLIVVEKELAFAEDFKTILNILNGNNQYTFKPVEEKVLLSSGFIIYCKVQSNEFKNFERHFAYVMQTSGTTGSPMSVKVPHECIVPNITSLASVFDIGREDCVALISPYTFDPFVVQLFIALISGAKAAIIPDNIKLQPVNLCQLMFDDLKVSVLQPTPSLLYLLGHKLITTKLLGQNTTLKVLAFGGEPCPPTHTLKEWKHCDCKTAIFNLYGITEVSSWASCYRIAEKELQGVLNKTDDEQDDENLQCMSGIRSSVPLGRSLKDTIIEVRNEQDVSINEGFGTIYIGGGKRVCYVGEEIEPKAMRATGDLGYIHNGQIWYYGRQNRQIKRMGKIINLEWLEQTLSQAYPCHAFVAVIQTTSQQEGIYLYVQPPSPNDNTSRYLHMSIEKTLHDCLPVYAHPDYIQIIEGIFPMTPHGKVDTRKLLSKYQKKKYSNMDVTLHDFLMSAWISSIRSKSGICKLSPNKVTSKRNDYSKVNDDDQFTQCGGTSIDAVRMVGEIESWLNHRHGSPVELSELLDIILNKTFESLCRYVEQKVQGMTDKHECCDHSNSSKFTLHNPTSRKHSHPKSDRISKYLTPSKKKNKKEMLAFPCRTNIECFCSIQRGMHRLRCPICSHVSHQEKVIDPSPSNVRLDDIEWPGVNIEFLWKVDFHKCIDASPLLVGRDNAKVFIGSHGYIFKAVQLVDGKVVWETRLGDRIESSAAISRCGHFIIVGCYDGKIYILKRDNGTIAWTFQTGSQVKSSPCVDPSTGLIWIGSHDHHIYALDILKHECVTSIDCGGSCFSSPCVLPSHQLVFIATLTGRLLAVCSSNMTIKWSCWCPKPVFASPLAIAYGVVCACVDGNVFFYSLSGVLMWQFQTSGPVFSSPSIFLSNILFGCHDKHVYCISTTGKLKWRFASDSEVYGSPFVIVLKSTSDRISDNLYTDQQTSNSIHAKPSSPIHQQSMVIVCSTKGTLYCLSLDTGHLFTIWKFPGTVFSSPVVLGDKVVIGCRDDYLYCLDIKAKTT